MGEWKISKEELGRADELVFHAVSQPAASENERVEFISKLEEHSKSVPKPELKQVNIK